MPASFWPHNKLERYHLPVPSSHGPLYKWEWVTLDKYDPRDPQFWWSWDAHLYNSSWVALLASKYPVLIKISLWRGWCWVLPRAFHNCKDGGDKKVLWLYLIGFGDERLFWKKSRWSWREPAGTGIGCFHSGVRFLSLLLWSFDGS